MNSSALVSFGLIGGLAAFCQSPPQTPKFEVASIRPNASPVGRPAAEFLPGGKRFTASNISVAHLVILAYGITPQQIGPLDPITYTKYDVQASTDQAVSRNEMLRMIQSLLTERFKLKVHQETRDLSVYALLIDKRGPKLQRSQEQLPWTLTRSMGNEEHMGRTNQISFENASMTDLGAALSTLLAVGRIVIDKTGLSGSYDFRLRFTPSDLPGTAIDTDTPRSLPRCKNNSD